jgi:hypothetical protein
MKTVVVSERKNEKRERVNVRAKLTSSLARQ